MSEVRPIADNKELNPVKMPNSEFMMFNNLNNFTETVAKATGITFDFASVVELHSDFLQASEQYLILNVKDFDPVEPNNLLFLTGDKAFLFAKTPLSGDTYKPFEKVYLRSYGRSTILAFLTLSKVSDSYKSYLESLINATRELEQKYDNKKYGDINFEFERLTDRVEDFHDLLLKLQERGYREIETRYISFDYDVLIAETSSLLDRCHRRSNMLKEVGRDHELQVTMELNLRMERLNDVVKRLTAITLILMVPTLIASHFGMNFTYMPELKIWWAYPTVVGVQVVIVGIGIYVFRKIGWF